AALVGLEPSARPGGQLVEHHEARVVPVARVAGTGVAEPDDQPAVHMFPFKRYGAAGALPAAPSPDVTRRRPRRPRPRRPPPRPEPRSAWRSPGRSPSRGRPP